MYAKTTSLSLVASLLSLASLTGCSGAPSSDDASASSSVVGGRAETAYPAVGFLTEGSRTVCGATLIRNSETLVAAVTAAHCVHSYWSPTMVGFGKLADRRFYNITKTVTHPSWDLNEDFHNSFPWHDLAVVILEKQVKDGTGAVVEPARIAAPTMGCEARYVGYGRDTEGDVNRTDGYDDARKSTQECVTQIPEREGLVLVDGKGGGLCWGDSGGPLMVDDDTHPTDNNYVSGVLSQFDFIAGTGDCHEGNKMMFTSLTGEKSFLACALGEDGCDTTNGDAEGLKCVDPNGCDVYYAHDLDLAAPKQVLGHVGTGTIMGVFVRSGSRYVVSYPMADRDFQVQLVEVANKNWIPGPNPITNAGARLKARPADGNNDEGVVCMSKDGCDVYSAHDLKGTNATLGHVACGTKMGVFLEDTTRYVGKYVVSYPMPDRKEAVQWITQAQVGQSTFSWGFVNKKYGNYASLDGKEYCK